MTLPSKNRRRLRLDSGNYRYIFSAHKSLDRGRLVVEAEHGQSPILIVQWLGLLKSKRDVVPRRHLRDSIEYAIKSGWLDSESSQFEIGCDATAAGLSFLQRPKNVGNDWFWEIDRQLDRNDDT